MLVDRVDQGPIDRLAALTGIDPTGTSRGLVMLLVENESVPTDARVWNEACLLRDAGFDVTVVCPIGDGRDPERVTTIDGITVRRFPLRMAAGGVTGFVVEYLSALWRMAAIVWRSERPIRVIHSANPPDVLFLVGLVPKLRWGTKLVFDHHDLVPELFEARFGHRRLLVRLTRAAEWLSFRTADAVISTNESYRDIAIERGGKSPDRVRVVRNARDRASFRPVTPDPELKRGRPHLAVYVGVMGHQDGADVAVRVAGIYRNELGRDDLQVTFVGRGDQLDDCKRLVAELGIEDMVHFAGWCEKEEVLRYLSTADIGLATDPPSPLNDRSTMIKVVEYAAVGLPIVSFDLPESVVTAGDAARYAPAGDERAMAEQLAALVDDPELRAELGRRAIARSDGALSWETARRALLETYRTLEDDRRSGRAIGRSRLGVIAQLPGRWIHMRRH